jgi:hypothetical protein
MARKFDTTTLGALHKAKEVRIRPGKSTKPGVIIWVVTTGDEVFVRSVQGRNGKWYQRLAARKEGTLEIDHRLLPVTAHAVADKATIGAVSAEYLRKYATSPYAQSIVRADTLPTTLRLEPR